MPLPSPPSKPTTRRREPRMIERGLLCMLIGAAVLIAPYFVTSGLWQQMTGGARVVGWFAVVLGAALVLVDVMQRLKQRGH